MKEEIKHFRIGGHDVELSRSRVEKAMKGITHEAVLKHAVKINGTWYPVKQAIEIAARVPRADVISTEARRVFRSLSFEVRP